jgi:hypothetical protein
VELYAKAPGESDFSKVATDPSPSATGSFNYNASAGDGSYRFYTVASDKAGNSEVAPASADSETLLDTSAPSSNASSSPLSNSTTITVGYSASDASPSSDLDKVELYAKSPGESDFSKVATDSAPTSSGSFNYNATAGDGRYRFYTVATDKVGNAESAPASADSTTLLDTAKPASSANSPALSSSTTIQVDYSASDSSPSSDLDKLELYAKAPGDSDYAKVATDSSPSASGSFNYDASAGDGTYRFYTIASDKAGNAESAPASADSETLLDTAKPDSSANSPALSSSTIIQVDYSANDSSPSSDLDKVELYAKAPGESGFTKVATDSTPAATGSFNYSASAGDGTYGFYTVATDEAGNSEVAPASADSTTLLDTAKPDSSASSPALSSSTTIQVDYSASDSSPSSDLDKVELYAKAPGESGFSKVATDSSPSSSGSFSYHATAGDGTYRFYTIASDKVGNAESAPASADSETLLDATAPGSSASSPALSNATGITVNYSASDGAGLGLNKVELYAKAPGESGFSKVATDSTPAATGSFNYSASAGDGTYRFYTIASDKAGNAEGAPASADSETLLDTQRPESAASSPALSSSTTIQISYTASDAKEVELWVQKPGASDYSFVASDTTPASPTFDYGATGGDGTYRFYTRARDAAGNYEEAPAAADTATILDTSSPNSSAASPSTSSNTTFAVTYTASDGSGAGLDRVELWVRPPTSTSFSKVTSDLAPGTSGSFSYTANAGDGSYSFSTVAQDKGGNRETMPSTPDSTTVLSTVPVYNFSGFFRPVENLPTLNAANSGSAIPVKFSLGGNQGMSIFEVGYPKSQIVPCDSTAPVDGIDQTVSAGSSSLSYDASSNQYTYVWKTEKAWSNTCRQLVVRLKDGTYHRANFKFTK